MRIDRGFKEIVSPSIQKDLLTLEEQEVRVSLLGCTYIVGGEGLFMGVKMVV